MKIQTTLALALLTTPFAAQDLCEGNGVGEAYIEVGPAYIGGSFSHDIGSPNVPSSFVAFSFSDGFQETIHPVLGSVCLNVFSPAYGVIILPTDATGNLHFSLALPNIPSWVTLAPFYSNAATFEGGLWSSSKTVPLYFENRDSWTPVSNMNVGRLYHTATQLGENGRDNRIKIFVAGGGGGTATIPAATNLTEVFDPLSRSFTAGPSMFVARSTHTATRLQDGRVLIAGGLDSNGICHASTEIYDHDTGTILLTGNMSSKRAGHTATLLDDGRVLVTGGFEDYQNPATAWAAALSSSQNTAEIYDPVTGFWLPVAPTMSANRSGHTATKMPDGTVMLVNGVRAGGLGGGLLGSAIVPFFTNTVELFDPVSETFSALPPLDVPILFGSGGGRAFHGASLLPNGNVLVCGGTHTGGSYSEAISTIDCQTWDGSGWVLSDPLPTSTSWHNQIVLRNGQVLISGGLTSTSSSLVPVAFTGIHDGATLTGQNAIGLNPGLAGGGAVDSRGIMTATEMHDGAVLFLGGSVGGSSSAGLTSGYVYTPAP